MTITTDTQTQSMVDTLNAVAALLNEHPDLPLPYVTIYNHVPDKAEVKWYLHIRDDREDATAQRETAQQIIRTIGGKWGKSFADNDARFAQKRDSLDLLVVVLREAVCVRRVVGTETVTLPAVEARPERTEEREIVEWDCAPVLGEAVTA